MNKEANKSSIQFSIFILTVLAVFISIIFREDIFDTGLPLGLIIAFLLMLIVTSTSLTKFKGHKSLRGILSTISLAALFILLPKAITSTLTFSLKILPFYVSIFLGIMAGYIYFIKSENKINIPLFLALFPILMSLGANTLWVHRIEYGNWTGEVAEKKVIPFELKDKAGDLINNESLNGKIVLLDFWFISCGPCWVKFPDVQRIYEKYQSNLQVELYAVNRPMNKDKPGALFSKIEGKGYSFPVLQGSQEMMDKLEVYKYPTVILLNKQGKIVFMGELDDAEKKLESMLGSL